MIYLGYYKETGVKNKQQLVNIKANEWACNDDQGKTYLSCWNSNMMVRVNAFSVTVVTESTNKSPSTGLGRIRPTGPLQNGKYERRTRRSRGRSGGKGKER